ncbi:MAG: class I SAM-dependent methyltransferase [bacterium]|nr:class I SAM-dependent methyltransferase [bacterium]
MSSRLFYDFYDIFFQDKNYSAEVDIILSLGKKFGPGFPGHILEIGCGTGNHTVELARKAVDVLAIDIDPSMTALAKNKIKQKKLKNVIVLEKKVEQLDLKKFDLAVAMFNVVTYIQHTNELLSFMKGVSSRLEPGGVFIFDSWNGVAAMKDPPKKKQIHMKRKGELIELEIIPRTSFINKKTKLSYNIKVTKGKLIKEDKFIISQKLWTPLQIGRSLKQAGLELLWSSPLLRPEQKATEKDWKIMFVAKKLF